MTITPEQIKFRKGKIGASQFGQAIGHGYGTKTRAELYHQMKGHMPPTVETMAMRVGNFMEGFILSEYSKQTGRKGEEYPDTQIHPDDPRIICHCDGITYSTAPPRLIEIKNVGPRMKDAWDRGVPDYVWVQACGQSMLTGIHDVDVAAYFGGSDLKVFELTFTDTDHAQLYDGLKDFLGYMDRDEEPPHVIADLPNLDKYYEVKQHVTFADNAIKADAVRLAFLKNKAKIADDDKEIMDGCEFRIKEYMGQNDSLVDVNDIPLFTWKQGRDKEVVDWKSMAWELWKNSGKSDEYWFDLQEKNTTTKTGNRTFLCKIKD